MNREVLINSLEEFMSETDARLTALGTAADKIRRLTEGFYAPEAQRNTLAAQVDDLRNINAALRKALSDPAPCTGTGGCDCLPDDEA